MKYGVILYNYEKSVEKNIGYNLGDSIQTIAVLELYRQMGISDDDIIYVGMHHLKDYRGEYIILPILGVGIQDNYAPPYSPNIIPVFISSHFADDVLTNEQVQYLQTYGPVGCRDEWSLDIMRKHGIPSFLSGCISILYDTWRCKENNNKIYAIDVPEIAKAHIDKAFFEQEVVYDTHLVPFLNKGAMTQETAYEYLNIAKKRLMDYSRAKLVISSRLHALAPSIAMGTPVIGIFENVSYRFSWLDKYIKLYTEKEINEVNWNPKVLELSYNSEIRKVFVDAINQARDKYTDIYKVSSFYENRNKAEYANRYRKMIMDFFENSKGEIRYAIFGCGLIGRVCYKIMNELYPKSELVVAIDNYKKGRWNGVEVIKPEEFEGKDNTKVLIASFSGKESAYTLMKKIGYKESSDFCYLASING